MKVKIKKLHPDAVIPSYAKDGDAGMDLTATSLKGSEKFQYAEYGTGLSIEIPKGYVGYIFPRSSISKSDLTLSNSIGVIDSGYRGEIKLRFHQNSAGILQYAAKSVGVSIDLENAPYELGERIGQLVIMPIPTIEFEEVDELSETERSDGGFGSSGR